jgi:tRNA threonylcarbamoyladenosine biosynthesis protein TsaB
VKDEKIILAIETAVAGGSLALYRDGEILAEISGDPQISRAADLLPNIDKLLRSNDLELGDIGLIAVSLGPGSYTGIRIGISTALGLGRSVGVEIQGISLLRAIASDAAPVGQVIAAVPTGREDIAWQIFDGGSALNKPQSGSPDDLTAALHTFTGPTTLHHCCLELRREEVPTNISVTKPDRSLAALVAAAAARGLSEPDATPIYLLNPARSRNLF